MVITSLIPLVIVKPKMTRSRVMGSVLEENIIKVLGDTPILV